MSYNPGEIVEAAKLYEQARGSAVVVVVVLMVMVVVVVVVVVVVANSWQIPGGWVVGGRWSVVRST